MKTGDKIFTIFQRIVTTIFTLPFLAPIFMVLKLDILAKPIYFLYSFTCHQLSWRSIHIGDFQAAWCVRDMFIWGGIAVSTFITKKFNIRISWKILPIFILPIALDGGIQTIGTIIGLAVCPDCAYQSGYTSNNLARALTGGWFGLGIGMFLSTLILELNDKEELKKSLKKNLEFAAMGLGALMIFYISIVGVWNISSVKYKPVNILDLAVKTPAMEDQRWIRQDHGGCNPKTPKNITKGNSFTDVMFFPSDCF